MMNAQAQLPEMLRYSKSLNALSIPARQNLRKFFPETSRGGYTTTNRTIRIPISGQDVFIDTNRSVLSFRLSATYTDAGTNDSAYLDNSAYSLIDSVRVLDSTGAVLEEINNYSIVANRLADLSMPVDERQGLRGKYSGFTDTFPYSAAGLSANNIVSAASLGAAANSKRFQLPIVCSGIMNMSSKAHNGGVFLPVALTNGITVEINLIPNIYDAFVASTTITNLLWQVDDVSYDACVVSFDSNLVRELQAAAVAAGGLFLSSYTYQTQQITDNSTASSLNANVRAKSIKSIYCITRANTQNNAIGQMLSASPAPTNASDTNSLFNCFLSLASMTYPNVALQNFNDVSRELSKATGTAMAGVADRDSFESTTTAFTTTAASPARFTVGFDLDTVSREQLEAGYDNQSNSQPIVINFTSGTAVARTHIIASLVDMVVKLDPIAKSLSVSY